MKKASMRDRVRQRAEERATEHSGKAKYLNLPADVEFWKPESDGQLAALDFLPYVVSDKAHPDGIPVGEEWYRRIILVHFDIGPAKRSFLCPRTFSANARCPCCEEADRLAKDWENHKDEVKALRPKERELFNVVDLDEKEPRIRLFEYSTWLFGQSLEQAIREADDDEVGDFAEKDCGKTVLVRWRAGTLKKRGGEAILEANPDGIQFEERQQQYDPKEDADILADIIDLDSILVRSSYEEIDAAMNGVDPELVAKKKEDDLPYGDTPPAAGGRGRRGRGTPAEEPEAGGDTPPADEPPADEPPARGRRGRGAPADEPPADESPARGRRGRR